MSQTINADKQVKSKERVQKHGEVFTPQWVVNDMLDLLPADVWSPNTTFLEPACGEGAFLKEIYKRKLQNIKVETQSEWEWQAAIATSSIYGIELLEDNAKQCMQNLMQIFSDFYRILISFFRINGYFYLLAEYAQLFDSGRSIHVAGNQ